MSVEFFGNMLGSEMAGSYCCSVFNCLKNLQTDFHNGYINLYPQPIANKGSFLSTSSPTLVVRFVEDISYVWVGCGGFLQSVTRDFFFKTLKIRCLMFVFVFYGNCPLRPFAHLLAGSLTSLVFNPGSYSLVLVLTPFPKRTRWRPFSHPVAGCVLCWLCPSLCRNLLSPWRPFCWYVGHLLWAVPPLGRDSRADKKASSTS